MKRKIICGIRIYLFVFLYLFITSFVYSFYLLKTNNDSNKIIEIIFGSTTFILLGLLYALAVKKRGLIAGLLAGLIHMLLVNFIFILAIDNYNVNIITSIIYTISSALGGCIGSLFFKRNE